MFVIYVYIWKYNIIKIDLLERYYNIYEKLYYGEVYYKKWWGVSLISWVCMISW